MRFAALCKVDAITNQLTNQPVADRRLRIGYVSADFGNHPVGYFLANVLPAHDRKQFEVFCYSNRAVEDDMSKRLRESTDHWRSIYRASDAEAGKTIRQDQIDLLVDLSGHTGGNRLMIFADRQAPVQVSWLGYFGTTGLTTMDFVLADRFVAPGEADAYFTETVWRLPDSYLCFSVPELSIEVQAPPAASGQWVTFGCFNNYAKISPETVALWVQVLNSVTHSRLLLKTHHLGDGNIRQKLLNQFGAHGISSDRISLEGASPRAELLASYNRVDIALDPTPYGGGTTTAEALWMGVPVVTLRGKTWVGRVSESILNAVGASEWVAVDNTEYVEIAARLASDITRLAELRTHQRLKFTSSPLCNSSTFTLNLEKAYREMWKAWCFEQSASNVMPNGRQM